MLLLVQEGQAEVADRQRDELGAQLGRARGDRVDQPPPDGRAEGAGAGAAHQDEDAEVFR
jgi:hypothetical protein